MEADTRRRRDQGRDAASGSAAFQDTVDSHDEAHGILDFAAALRFFRLRRLPPSRALSPWIDSYWEVRWALPTGTTHLQTNLSHACINAIAEDDGVWLYGVPGPTFVRELKGAGRAFGVKFRPGAFYPWIGEPFRPLYDRRVPLAEAFGEDAEEWGAIVRAEEDFGRGAELSDAFWEGRRPSSAPGAAAGAVERIVGDRTLLRVEDVCTALGYDPRALQRLFRREVGVGPKEVIRRYRLMEAAERLAKEEDLAGGDLAYELGYADQAHFIRDFKAVTGLPPAAYRKRQENARHPLPSSALEPLCWPYTMEETTMIYRTLAGERVSQLGFGAMRLPTVNGTIDEGEAISMIRLAIDRGVNYVDTAWPYHEGKSEPLVGAALRDGYRQRTFLATKSPVWLMKKKEDFDSILDQQLRRLETDHIDFYMLHALDAGRWKTCRELDALEFGERAKKAGKIGHFGFSFHDALPAFKDIVDGYAWDFCQIQYNLLDRKEQAGEEGLRYARSKGIGVIVMEPLRGGNLVGPLPERVRALYEAQSVHRGSADWALRWVWDDADVALVLSGMSSRAQVEQNLLTAEDAAAGALSGAERKMIEQVEAEYRRLMPVGCTACGYCMPCPSGVNIPRNFAVFNEYYMFEKSEAARGAYRWVDESQRADKCVDCGACEEHCPQRIEIRKELKRVVAELA